MKILKGDHVRVLQGKDRGLEGEVLHAYPERNMVLVDGVNIAKKATRASSPTSQAGIIDKGMPIAVSSVGIVCKSCKKPVRVGYKGQGREKVRVCKGCGGEL